MPQQNYFPKNNFTSAILLNNLVRRVWTLPKLRDSRDLYCIVAFKFYGVIITFNLKNVNEKLILIFQ